MDLNMPVMGGMDATKELRMMGCKTPIVALTGNDCSEDKSEFFRAGGDDFLAKPLEQAKLRLIMQKYLKSYNYGDNDPLSSSLKPIMSRRRGAGRMRTAAGNNRFNRFGSQQRKSESSSTTPTTITIKKSINEDPGNINNNNNNIINNNSIDNRRNSSNNLNNISPKLSSLNPTSNNDTNVNTPKNRRLLPATGHPMLDDMPSPTDNNSSDSSAVSQIARLNLNPTTTSPQEPPPQRRRRSNQSIEDDLSTLYSTSEDHLNIYSSEISETTSHNTAANSGNNSNDVKPIAHHYV
eukprot:TRINITY_DN1280_c0_g1_i3.p1 TRINITY_DN1280_c0_g1~~TRINITY_DN1280_c0_g1_i3.p1  ORF type:complete len:294 (+),score=81.80 TRINITY_DN1280_c0_g1_i3:203-1084(+)